MSDLILTYKNHFEFFYDEDRFRLRSSPHQKWTFKYGRCERPPSNFKDECLLASQQIAEQASKTIGLGMSGGIDSEVVAESLVRSKVPFKAFIIRFPNGLNFHDISWAQIYCSKNQIPIQYFDIDPISFYQTEEFKNIAKSTHCFYPMLVIQMKLAEFIHEQGYFPVLGSADCYLEKNEFSTWIMFEREIFCSLYRFQVLKKFSGALGFFQWNPELIWSFLNEPEIYHLITKDNVSLNSTETKRSIYEKYFNTTRRQKYYGWENFEKIESSLRQVLSKEMIYAATEHKMPLPQVINQIRY